ncbi:MAG: DUF2079 domain-containing protein [Planctomycetaceae bacterium]
MAGSRNSTSPGKMIGAIVLIAAGSAALAMFLQTVLSSSQRAAGWMSAELRQSLLKWLAVDVKPAFGDETTAVPFAALFLSCLAVVGTVWFTGSFLAARLGRTSLLSTLSRFGLCGGTLLLFFGLIDFAAPLLPEAVQSWLVETSSLLFSFVIAAFLTVPVWLAARERPVGLTQADSVRATTFAWVTVLAGVAVYVVTFTWMNWGLYFNLLLPHGDSAMYEEHIWNLTHGKGFRSYLDQGLFLGEHIQVVHLLLTPLHMLWPSHLLLELTESLALGVTAVPIFLIAKRHTGSSLPSALLGIAWLLYFPMHYLDVAIDFKTFRPMCFGIPAVLFGIDQWERRRFKTAWVLFVIALAAKEDFALILAPLLLFLGLAGEGRTERAHGLVGCVAVGVYLVLVVLFVIPAFRSGEIVHYSRYFGELGSSPTEIVKTSITSPLLVASKLFSGRSVLYSVLLLLPCGFLPLLSLRRLLVAVPVLGMLYLLELSPTDASQPDAQQHVLIPFHHFRATVLPILWWAAAVGLARFQRISRSGLAMTATSFACLSAICCGLFYSMSPLGIGFHDTGSRMHWRDLYVESERARQVQKVLDAIPDDARVASTDFVHTRLTHCERSYDYSGYRTEVPDDADYIVIDAKHPWAGYSMASRYEDVRELQLPNAVWEPVPVDTDDYFLVLRRIKR